MFVECICTPGFQFYVQSQQSERATPPETTTHVPLLIAKLWEEEKYRKLLQIGWLCFVANIKNKYGKNYFFTVLYIENW